MKHGEVGGVSTTDVCNLSCVMCHFNGPKAVRLDKTLTIEQVRRFVSSVPPGPVWFAATGDFLMDPNALEHLRVAVTYGHQPCVLTNGQLFTPEIIDRMLEIGVRQITISVDAIDPASYRKIRRGGELGKILEACAYLRSKQQDYPELLVTIANVLFRNTLHRQEEFVRFWAGRADKISFQVEYFDIFKMRMVLSDPGERVDCDIRVFLMPNGKMVPCCAMSAYQHNRDLDWLPHIDKTTPQEALDHFKKLYADPGSPLGKLCQNCEWWIMFKQDEKGESPFCRTVPLPAQPSGTPYPADFNLSERLDTFDLKQATITNGAVIAGDTIVTGLQQWSYAVLLPIQDDPQDRLTEYRRMVVRVEATVDEGSIGISIAQPDLSKFIAPERVHGASSGRATFEIPLNSPRSGIWLVIRNTAAGGVKSKIQIHSIKAFAVDRPDDVTGDFVPVSQLVSAKLAAN